MSSYMTQATRAHFSTMDDLRNGKQGYAVNLIDPYRYSNSALLPVSLGELAPRVIEGIWATLNDLEGGVNTIEEITIGKTFVRARQNTCFSPTNPNTWKLCNGINGRWTSYYNKGYDGLVVICCVDRSMIPPVTSPNFNQEQYALALEQRAIQHFMIEQPGYYNLSNTSLATGLMNVNAPIGGIVYVAYKFKKNPPFGFN